MTLKGFFNGEGVTTDMQSGVPFAANTPFTMTGVFDDSSPNLVRGLPFPGFVSYAPSWVKLEVGGQTYDVQTYTQSPTTGFAIDVFDKSQPFGAGHYGIGFNQDPVHDGAGIVGDWLTATPDYTVASLVATTYSDFFGVGFGSGLCSMPGMPPCITTPIPLNGGADSLTLGTYDLTYSPFINDIESPPGAIATDLIFTASLAVIPEPSTWAMVLAGFVLLGFGAARRRASREGLVGHKLTLTSGAEGSL